MRTYLMPAGTSGDKDADQGIVSSLQEQTGCEDWAHQVVMPSARSARDFLLEDLVTQRGQRELKRLMPWAYDDAILMLDYENKRETDSFCPFLYSAAVSKQAIYLAQNWRRACGLYGLGSGRFGYHECFALMEETGFEYLSGSYYQRHLGEMRPVDLDAFWASQGGWRCIPYVQGNVADDEHLPIPVDILVKQLRDLQRVGVHEVICWIGLGKPYALEGAMNLWEAVKALGRR